MTKLYAITYHLKAAGKNYGPLYEELKNSPKWWHYLDSTWLIYTAESPKDLWNRVGHHIDQQHDFLLIIEVRDNCQGWLPEKAWEWIHQFAPAP